MVDFHTIISALQQSGTKVGFYLLSQYFPRRIDSYETKWKGEMVGLVDLVNLVDLVVPSALVSWFGEKLE